MPGREGLVSKGFLEEVVVGECAGAAGVPIWALCAPGRFMQELTEMLGFRPYRFYFYMWKFVSPLCMAVLTTASIIQLGVTPPGYSAWIKEEVRGDLKLQGPWHLPRPFMQQALEINPYRRAAVCQALPEPLHTRSVIFTTAQRERWHYPYSTHGETGGQKV